MNISLICPTRKRPHNIIRLIESAILTADKPYKLTFWFYVDDDDEETRRYITFIHNKYPQNDAMIVDIRFVVGPRIIMCEMSNLLANMAGEGAIAFIGDDIVFASKHWDTKIHDIFEASKDKILLVYGDDGIQRKALATHPILHSNWIKTLGRLTPPIFTGDWADNWVMDIAKKLDRLVYVEDIKMLHLHPTVGKAVFDEVYIEKYNRDAQNKSSSLMETYKDLHDQEVQKLRDFINANA